jgi:hypothetical protein
MPPYRPPELQAEYDRIGRERLAASREMDRMYRWELVRTCGEMLGWTVTGCVIAAWGFHVTSPPRGRMLLMAGILVTWVGVLYSLIGAYRRGEKRGDW